MDKFNVWSLVAGIFCGGVLGTLIYRVGRFFGRWK